MRVDREAQNSQPVLQIVLPQRCLPLEQQLPAPDVVDQDVKLAAFGIDPLYKGLDLTSLEMVDRDRDPYAAGGRDELGGLLDRLRAIVLKL